MYSLEIQAIVRKVTYKNWQFQVIEETSYIYLQLSWFDPVDDRLQKSRKWLLSPHMTTSEIVQTCLLAILTAEEHEARENFRFNGKKVYGPHINVSSLSEIAGFKEHLDLRPAPSNR